MPGGAHEDEVALPQPDQHAVQPFKLRLYAAEQVGVFRKLFEQRKVIAQHVADAVEGEVELILCDGEDAPLGLRNDGVGAADLGIRLLRQLAQRLDERAEPSPCRG